jgi:Actinobacteria/chloroflexi VLRF1 release factor
VKPFELPPERLARWLERWAAEHGGAVRTEARPGRVTITAADGASVAADPPFPPLPDGTLGTAEGLVIAPLLEHAARDRVVGVLLVRLGGHAAGVFSGTRLVDSKVGRRQVHGRNRKGGSSSGRFARRRDNQARDALADAADVAARVLLAHADDLEHMVLGGDRRALATVLEDPRLRRLQRLASERVLDVPDPRLDVLRGTPERFRATLLRVSPASPG